MRALHNLNGEEKQQMLLEIFPWIFWFQVRLV